MFTDIEELKKTFPNTMSMQEYSNSLSPNQPLIVFRNYNEPLNPPYSHPSVETFNSNHNPPPSASKFTTLIKLSSTDIINAIKSAVGEGNYALHISDGSYGGFAIFDIMDFLKSDTTDANKWIEETFDCDDFSQVLEGNVNNSFHGIAFGTIWYGPKNPNENWGHSTNIFIDAGKMVWLIEPQDDTFYNFNKDLWKVWMIII